MAAPDGKAASTTPRLGAAPHDSAAFAGALLAFVVVALCGLFLTLAFGELTAFLALGIAFGGVAITVGVGVSVKIAVKAHRTQAIRAVGERMQAANRGKERQEMDYPGQIAPAQDPPLEANPQALHIERSSHSSALAYLHQLRADIEELSGMILGPQFGALPEETRSQLELEYQAKIRAFNDGFDVYSKQIPPPDLGQGPSPEAQQLILDASAVLQSDVNTSLHCINQRARPTTREFGQER